MSGIATESLLSEQLAEQQAEILEARSPIVLDKERSYATEKKWSVRRSILLVFVMSVGLWAFIIIGVRQIL